MDRDRKSQPSPDPERGPRVSLDRAHVDRLERAVDWIADRDPRVAKWLRHLDFAASELVGVVGSEREGQLLVNPRAVADLEVKELAGALGAALLYTRVRASLSREQRRELVRRIAALRARVRSDSSRPGTESASGAEEREPM